MPIFSSEGSRVFERGDVLHPTGSLAPDIDPLRILLIEEDLETAIVIHLKRRDREGKVVHYTPLPSRIQLSFVHDWIASGSVLISKFVPPSSWSMTDDDYVSSASTSREADARRLRLKRRDEAFDAISPYLAGLSIEEATRQFAAIHSTIKASFRKAGRNPGAIIRSLCLYLMSLGRKNSLLPGTDRCGGRGKERVYQAPTGRPRIDTSIANYIMTSDDKERCALGMQLVADGKLLRDAYIECCNTFWSDCATDAYGNLTVKLWDPGRRPSFGQFEYWGERDEAEVRLRLFSPLSLDRQTNRDGSPSAGIHAVGVLGEFDSTSSDVYLTSVTSRLRRLPPMKRYVVKCPLTKAVLGFHLDWAAPSPRLALRTILATAEDKHELCKRFGIDCEPGDWPGVFLSSYRVDNGEMRADEITAAESEFGFRIEFTKSRAGEFKPNVESQHRADHLALDHRISGTTRGRQKKRGEVAPVENALLNFREYMRALLKRYLKHNSQLVPELAPIEMTKEGIPPTRINIFKWYCRTHQAKLIPVDIEHLRSFTLPSWPATLSEQGIQLMSEDGSRVLKALRYSSAELREDERFQKACEKRRRYKIQVRVDSNDMSKIFVPLSTGMKWIPNVAPVEEDRSNTSLADLIAFSEDNLKAKRDGRAAEEQAAAEEAFERAQVTSNARKEKRQEQKKHRSEGAKGPGYRKRKSKNSEFESQSLRKNAKDEAALLIPESKHAVASVIQSLDVATAMPKDLPLENPLADLDPDHLAFMAKITEELGYGS